MIFDLAILGAGPAGYNAADKAGAKGMSVILFEKRELGGVCLNEGCIPTKTLLYSAKIYDSALHGLKYGVSAEKVTIDFSQIMARKNKVVKKLVGGVGAKMRKNKVEVVKGEAVIQGKNRELITIESNGKQYEAKNLLICTGSEAFVPPIPGLPNNSNIVTNREILQVTQPPKTLVVIGGGVIGMEFASFFNSIGSKVIVIEMLDKILGFMDREMSEILQSEYAKRGVDFYLKSKVVEVKGNDVVFENAQGEKQEVTGDLILVSVGRKTNIAGFGLETLGVEIERGGIKVDQKMRTNVPNVFAAGDVTGFSQLAHTAYREAEVVINNLTGRDDVMRYNAIPGVVYTNPEISSVGITEEEAKSKGIEYNISKLPMVYSGRFMAENEGFNGLCKVLVGKKYGEVLGVHLLGNPSSEIIYGACMAIEAELTIKELEEVVFPHPTVSEIFKESLFELD